MDHMRISDIESSSVKCERTTNPGTFWLHCISDYADGIQPTFYAVAG